MKYSTSYIKPKKPRKVTESLFAIVCLLIIVAPISSVFAQTDPQAEERALEIVYPVFNDLTLTPTTGLPQYVQYLFRFAMAIIGLIILYVMISAGITYTMSAGNAGQLLEAKNSMLASFLGAIILISAFVLFNSINPNLTDLGGTDQPLSVIGNIVAPGIYLCDKQVPLIGETIRRYMAIHENETSTNEEITKIANEFRSIMNNENENVADTNKGSCYRANFSGNVDVFNFALNVSPPEDHSIFVIPERIYDNPATLNINEERWEYGYGIVFHEKDNFRGKCRLFRRVYGTSVEGVIGNIDFSRIKSFTVFKKPDGDVLPAETGATFSQCLNHNEGALCPPGLTGTLGQASYKVSAEPGYDKISNETLDLSNLAASNNANDILKGTRSIKFEPVDSYLVILFSGDDFQGNICEVISVNDNNLLDQPIGQCERTGDGIRECVSIFDPNQDTREALRDCRPCTKSAIVIRGKVLSSR